MVHGLETSKARSSEDSTTPSAKAVGQHTPLPWRLGDAAQHNADSIYAAASDGAELVADAYEMRRTDGDGEANAAFIVRACNSHYQLLSALKELVRYERDEDFRSNAERKAQEATDGNVTAYEVLMERAEQAISQAEEGL